MTHFLSVLLEELSVFLFAITADGGVPFWWPKTVSTFFIRSQKRGYSRNYNTISLKLRKPIVDRRWDIKQNIKSKPVLQSVIFVLSVRI